MKILIALSVLTLAVTVSCLDPASAQTSPTTSVQLPQYLPPNTWPLTVGVFHLTRTAGDVYVFRAESGDEIHLSRELVPISVARQGRVEWDLRTAVKLRWPLTTGAFASGQASVLIPSVMPAYGAPTDYFDVRFLWHAEAVELVSLAHGSVSAVRVVYTWRGGFDERVVGRFTAWYAAETGQLVKAQSAVPVFNFEVLTPLTPARP